MGDLKDPRWMYAKAGGFLAIGLLASTLILLEHPTLQVALLLALAIWAFCRLYYFLFYVLNRYIDPRFRFSGLGSVARYWIQGPAPADSALAPPPNPEHRRPAS